jgi:hypothetical protein
MKVQAIQIFKMPRTIRPVRQHNIPEVLSHKSNHKSGSIKNIPVKYSKMKKRTEELMQTGRFKTEILTEK